MAEILRQADHWLFAASTISDGDMSVSARGSDEEYLDRLATVFGSLAAPQSFQIAELCHGDEITLVSDSDSSFHQNCDGLMTDRPHSALVVTGADCSPVLLADDARMAIIHSGRKGTLNNVVGKAVQLMVKAGSDPSRIEAIIGPGICGDCYEVSQEIADEFTFKYPACIRERHLDLSKIIQTQLIQAGISEEEIQRVGGCTVESSDKWFSYRRDVREGRKLERPRVQAFMAIRIV